VPVRVGERQTKGFYEPGAKATRDFEGLRFEPRLVLSLSDGLKIKGNEEIEIFGELFFVETFYHDHRKHQTIVDLVRDSFGSPGPPETPL
jgi:hypothetical protein